jgi:hypothetical protein
MKPSTLTTSFRWSLDVGLVSQQCKVELHMAHTLNALANALREHTALQEFTWVELYPEAWLTFFLLRT